MSESPGGASNLTSIYLLVDYKSCGLALLVKYCLCGTYIIQAGVVNFLGV